MTAGIAIRDRSPSRVGGTAKDHGLFVLAFPAVAFLLAFYVLPIVRLIVSGIAAGEGGQTVFGFLADSYNLHTVWTTLAYGIDTTLVCLMIGVPAAVGAWLAPRWLRMLLLTAAVVPLTASTIVKTFGWMILMRTDGVVAGTIAGLGIAEAPVRMLFTVSGLIAGTANILLPFMILPIYAVLAQVDRELDRAAETLGASPLQRLTEVILPLAAPGIGAGSVLVFTQCIAAYAIPTLLMGDAYPLLSRRAVAAYLTLYDDTRGGIIALVMLLLAMASLSVPAVAGWLWKRWQSTRRRAT